MLKKKKKMIFIFVYLSIFFGFIFYFIKKHDPLNAKNENELTINNAILNIKGSRNAPSLVAPLMQLKRNQIIAPKIKKISNQDNIQDRIKGMIFGEAIGDYLGLYTGYNIFFFKCKINFSFYFKEFMTKDEAKKIYGEKLNNILEEELYQDYHRMRWNKGFFFFYYLN